MACSLLETKGSNCKEADTENMQQGDSQVTCQYISQSNLIIKNFLSCSILWYAEHWEYKNAVKYNGAIMILKTIFFEDNL